MAKVSGLSLTMLKANSATMFNVSPLLCRFSLTTMGNDFLIFGDNFFGSAAGAATEVVRGAVKMSSSSALVYCSLSPSLYLTGTTLMSIISHMAPTETEQEGQQES